MPRPVRTMTPLRQVRDALSRIEGQTVTQAIFATRLGVSASYINSLEAGSKTMTPDLAMRVSDLYGIDAQSLLDPKRGALHQFSSTLEEGIRSWKIRKNFDASNAKAGEQFQELTLPRLAALFEAAQRGKKAPFLLSRIERAMRDWTEEFHLEKTLKTIKQAKPLPIGERIELPSPEGRPLITKNFINAMERWRRGTLSKADMDADPEGALEQMRDTLKAIEAFYPLRNETDFTEGHEADVAELLKISRANVAVLEDVVQLRKKHHPPRRRSNG